MALRKECAEEERVKWQQRVVAQILEDSLLLRQGLLACETMVGECVSEWARFRIAFLIAKSGRSWTFQIYPSFGKPSKTILPSPSPSPPPSFSTLLPLLRISTFPSDTRNTIKHLLFTKNFVNILPYRDNATAKAPEQSPISARSFSFPLGSCYDAIIHGRALENLITLFIHTYILVTTVIVNPPCNKYT